MCRPLIRNGENHSNRFPVAIAIAERARWGREELVTQFMVIVGEGGWSVALVVGEQK